MQKLCQKRALEVNKLAKSQMSKAPDVREEEPMNLQSTFKPKVRHYFFFYIKIGVINSCREY